ncbi:hypothetical protein B0I21_11723 [Sphingobacterium paludis]|uniref:Uncharacterized protein n=1 Tax=Sphingobacterium paludis TaxID=1476465 RepID=A0A4R7CSF7_9SPHI|nr:hypothetical protein B0I21_11723 [Sphingobacterium paludis]
MDLAISEQNQCEALIKDRIENISNEQRKIEGAR